jgi:hypothetical protein
MIKNRSELALTGVPGLNTLLGAGLPKGRAYLLEGIRCRQNDPRVIRSMKTSTHLVESVNAGA